MENDGLFKNRIDLNPVQDAAIKLKQEISKVLVGQDRMVDMILIAILSNGHVLIEGVPGVAKTLTAKLISKMIAAGFSRIQFTPDLMPSDVLGTTIFNNKILEFEFKQGPIFSNIILIDEINRAPAKTQSALFEVMEERQVTIDGNTYKMDSPFLVFATQNPIEHEGTYRLPEAQLDRFLFRINITYPTLEEENQLLINANNRKEKKELDEVGIIMKLEEVLSYQKVVKHVHIEENLIKYIAELVNTTRNHPSLYLGASPRTSINILNSSKSCAALNGRDFVTPGDIQYVLYPVLNHRLYVTPEKELEGENVDDVIKDIIKSVDVPK